MSWTLIESLFDMTASDMMLPGSNLLISAAWLVFCREVQAMAKTVTIDSKASDSLMSLMCLTCNFISLDFHGSL